MKEKEGYKKKRKERNPVTGLENEEDKKIKEKEGNI